MDRGLFRREAVKQLTSPEQLDQRMQLTRRREWLALSAIGFLVLAILIWSVLGSVATHANGRAFLMRGIDQGVQHIIAREDGAFPEIVAGLNTIVEPDGLIATYQSDDGSQGELRNPFDERIHIIELLADRGTVLTFGTPIVDFEFIDRPLEALIYLPDGIGKTIEPGMGAEIVLDSFAEQEFGFLRGTVTSVAPFPATNEGMMRILHNQSLVDEFRASAGSGPIAIHIELETDQSTPSGFGWSASDGPDTILSSGVLGEARVIVESQPPIRLAFP